MLSLVSISNSRNFVLRATIYASSASKLLLHHPQPAYYSPARPLSLSEPSASSSKDKVARGLLERYEGWLQKYPRIYTYHRLVVDGSKWCISDLKILFPLWWSLFKGTAKLEDLSAQQLYIYIQNQGQQLLKLPLPGVLAFLPAGFPLIFVGVIFAPRLVLTRHFWTPEQSQIFQEMEAKRNARNHFPVILSALRQQKPNVTLDKLPLSMSQALVDQLGLLPQSLDECSQLHLFHLKRVHNIWLPFTTGPLRRRLHLLHLLDIRMAAQRSIVANLDLRDLQTHLYLRKLDYTGLSANEMRELLNQWLDHFKSPYCGPVHYAHVPVLMQTKLADLQRSENSGGIFNLLETKLKQIQWEKMGKELAERTADLARDSVRKAEKLARDPETRQKLATAMKEAAETTREVARKTMGAAEGRMKEKRK